MILILMVEGARAVISFCILSAIPGYMVVYYMVRFYAMNLQMPVTESTVDPSDAEKYRDDIDKFIDEVQAACPDSLCDQMGNSCWKWMQLATAEAFVNSAWSGIALAIPLSF